MRELGSGGEDNMVRPSVGPEAQKKQARNLERLKELRAIAERARLAADQAEATLLNASVELMLERVLDPGELWEPRKPRTPLAFVRGS
ncbi:hypothetical protein [Streptomyces sp. NPDC056544]|uniref:hypothetical protein n=1 Tax=unclassified Streptomyces TaxID=2593676 RepID=UPI0036C18F9E